jgi:hybrid polyketide synthase/nonribosomal peptide synthetase FtdB
LYQRLNEQGFEFGPAFRNVHALWRGTDETLAEITLPESLHSDAGYYRFHPALMDACFQAAVQALLGGALTIAEDEVLLPINIERVQMWGDAPVQIWSHGRLRGMPDLEARTFTLDLEVYDREGRALGEIAGLQLKRVKRKTLDRTFPAAEQDWLFEIQWRKALRPAEVTHADLLSRPGTWLILEDERGVGESLRTRLTAAGQRCVLARHGQSFVGEVTIISRSTRRIRRNSSSYLRRRESRRKDRFAEYCIFGAWTFRRSRR